MHNTQWKGTFFSISLLDKLAWITSCNNQPRISWWQFDNWWHKSIKHQLINSYRLLPVSISSWLFFNFFSLFFLGNCFSHTSYFWLPLFFSLSIQLFLSSILFKFIFLPFISFLIIFFYFKFFGIFAQFFLQFFQVLFYQWLFEFFFLFSSFCIS